MMSHLELLHGGKVSPATALPSLTGTWRATQTPGGTPFNIEFTASERTGRVLGHGEFTVGTVRGVPFSVTGSHVYPRVRVTIHAAGVEDAYFRGMFAGEHVVDGELVGSGFCGLPLSLRRSPGSGALV